MHSWCDCNNSACCNGGRTILLPPPLSQENDTKKAAKLGIENIDAEIGTDRQEAESDDDDNGYSKEEE